MRIAQIAPLTEPVPPLLYGGIERVVSHLTDELVAMGHDVTLFASGDSGTRARLVAGWPHALRYDSVCRDTLTPHAVMLEQVAKRAREFDILHFHFDYWYFLRFVPQSVPVLTTLHGRLDLQAPTYEPLPGVSLVPISDAQRQQLPQGRFLRTVYHGIRPDLLSPRSVKQDYLAFLGRVSPEKGVDKAIHIAGQAGFRLKIAAKVDPADRAYYEHEIRPLIQVSPWVEFIGEIGDAQKSEFLSSAHALLFPINWPEPFGLAMIESMACGTPVIAFDRGSVPEVVEDGLSGFVVSNEAAAIRAVSRLGELDRRLVRRQFDRRFTARRMAADYVSLYQGLCGHACVAAAAST
jgi:glycosyltransferase involved in cell wall biosynthesis